MARGPSGLGVRLFSVRNETTLAGKQVEPRLARAILLRMSKSAGQSRFWVSVHYRCCNVYQRVYFAQGAAEAVGHCPKCLREVRFRLTQSGDRTRFFAAED